jgi:hypothetical protein
MNPLTKKQQDLCAYTGLFGSLINATCLIQHIIITRSHWVVFVMLGIYIFAIISFGSLGFQKAIAPWLLVITAILLLLAELVFVFGSAFSLVVLLAFLYNVIVVVLLFVEGLPARLREKARLIRSEELAWKDKLGS